jgi:hypothetical protein
MVSKLAPKGKDKRALLGEFGKEIPNHFSITRRRRRLTIWQKTQQKHILKDSASKTKTNASKKLDNDGLA